MALPPARTETVSARDAGRSRRTLTLPAAAGDSLAAAAVATIVTTGGAAGSTQPGGTSYAAVTRFIPLSAVSRALMPMPRPANDSQRRQKCSLEAGPSGLRAA